jgi:transcriptional repressor NrdR
MCLHSDTKVIDKRDVEGVTRRRRECLKCKKRFSTKEFVERAELRVVKKNGNREPFDYEKMKRGVMRAFEKRPVSDEQIDKMLTNVEDKLRKQGKEIPTTMIGDLLSKEIKKLDKVAYIRFASVYKEFAELDDFKREIKVLVNG